MTGGYPVALARYGGQGEVTDLIKSGARQHVPRAAPFRAYTGHLMGFAVMSPGAGRSAATAGRRKDRGPGHGDRDLSTGRAAYVTVWACAGVG